MAKLTTAKFRFRKHDRIGANAAEEDTEYLSKCFVDTGDLGILEDTTDTRSILLGRTGAGKTALLEKVAERNEHVVAIDPEHLSLAYLSNSTIIRYLTDLDVDLDLFYRLLWRHVFAVELIKERFRITTEDEKKSWINRIFGQFLGNKRKEAAMQYLIDWGQHFWQETEYRIKEVTRKLESDIKAKMGVKVGLFSAGLTGERQLTKEERADLKQRAQDVVNSTQIRKLLDVIGMLANDFLTDPQYRIFITIDRLDENWVEDRIRYRLIRALIEAVRDFGRVKHAKIIVAVRRDLLDRVVRETRDTGFQEEKYDSLYLKIQWTEEQLFHLLDSRIDALVKEQYTTKQVTHRDILPKHVDHVPIDDFLITRTMYRPRDIITFFNTCIEHSNGKPLLTVSMLKRAEDQYSRERLRSLADEWQSNYPDVIEFAPLLRKQTSTFIMTEITDEQVHELCLKVVIDKPEVVGPLVKDANLVAEDTLPSRDFLHGLMLVFYRVGLIGLKTEAFNRVTFSYSGRETLPRTEINDTCAVSISPMFWRILGIVPVV